MKTIETGYTPRPFQRVLHAKLKRFNVLVCHRRFGKTVFAINELGDQAFRCTKRNPHYAYIGPSYGQVKRVAWDYVKEMMRNIPGVKFNEAELRVEVPRPHMGDKITIWLLSGENPDSLRGIYLDGCVVDEYAEQNPIIWTQVLRPALSDRQGWAIFIGTPKGRNHFYDLLEAAQTLDNWFTVILRASETNVVPSEELADARSIMSAEEYAQEYECDFAAALIGAYYGQAMAKAERDGRITSVPYNPAFEVHTYWDLGVDDQTAIWYMQECGRELHWIDYHECSNKGFDQIIQEAIKGKEYLFGLHYFPHDVQQRELSTNKSRLATLESLLQPKNCRVVERHKVEDRINATRMVLARSWFDKVKCKKGIEALQNYQRKYDAKDKTFVGQPLHNWASHGADAFGQGAIGYRDAFRTARGSLPQESSHKYNVFDY